LENSEKEIKNNVKARKSIKTTSRKLKIIIRIGEELEQQCYKYQ
jgi:hypothetical protein